LASNEPAFTLLQLITHGGGVCPVPFEFFSAAMAVYEPPAIERPHSTDLIYAFTPGTGDSEGHPYQILRVGSTVLGKLLFATDGALNIKFALPFLFLLLTLLFCPKRFCLAKKPQHFLSLTLLVFL
jgi:hypothetical protein